MNREKNKRRESGTGRFKRILALVLAVAVFLTGSWWQNFSLEAKAADVDTSGYTSIEVSQYSSDIYMYNYMNYTNTDQTVTAGAGKGFKLNGSLTDSYGIYVGNYAEEDQNDTSAINQDINVAVDGLSAGALTVNTVYGGGNAAVNMYAVDTASTITSVTVADNAVLNLTVNADLNITTLTMGEGSTLNLSVASDATCIIGTLSGSGAVSVSGEGTLSLGSAEMASLSVSDTTVSLSGNVDCSGELVLENASLSGSTSGDISVTAGDNITVTGGSVSSLAFLGFGNTSNAARSITFADGTKITDTDALGISSAACASDGGAGVAILGLDTLSADSDLSSTTFVSDFGISYSHEGTAIENYTITGYRAAYTYGEESGTITAIYGTIDNGVFQTSTTLPTYDGGSFNGWYVNGISPAITALTDGDNKALITEAVDLLLTTEAEDVEVTVTWDLGFEPDEYSNTDYTSQTWTSDETMLVGDTLTLDTPTQLGYTFTGWKITTGDGRQLSSEATSCTIAYSDLTESGMNLEAQWTANTYSFRLSFATSSVSSDNIQISFDNGTNWVELTDLSSSYAGLCTYNSTGNYLSFSGITYGETFGTFFSDKGYSFPVLKDTSDASVVQSFAGWVTSNNQVITEDSIFKYGNGGALDNFTAGSTLTDYAGTLNTAPFTFFPAWGTMSFTLTASKVSGWEIVVGGAVQEADGDTYNLSVLSGTTVTFRTSYTNANEASLWGLTNLTTSGRIYLTEGTYSQGDQYLNYTFTMPTANVNAVYGADDSDYHFDLYQSAITFEEDVEYNGLSRDGFWYNYRDEKNGNYSPLFAKLSDGSYKGISELTDDDNVSDYFYTWDYSTAIGVTSNNRATANQLTVVDTITVYLKNCNLTETDAYANDAAAATLADHTLEGASSANLISWFGSKNGLGQYANIIVDNTSQVNYTLTLYVDGENTVNFIAPSYYAESGMPTLQVQGKDGRDRDTLTLGSLLGYYTKVTIGDVSIKEYEEAELKYLVYSPSSNTNFTGCRIEAGNRRIYLRTSLISGTSDIVIGSLYVSWSFNLQGSAYLHIKNNMEYVWFGGVSGSASLLVEGDLVNLHTSAFTCSINTTGSVIVEGSQCDLACLSLVKGTIIANALILDYSCTISGGTIIANVIMNRPDKGFSINADGSYTYKVNYTAPAESNGDDSPFLTYSSTVVGIREYAITGGNIYLFSYYNVTADGGFDTSVTAIDSDNPVKPWVELAESSGISAITNAVSIGTLDSAVESCAETYARTPECFVLGDSTYTASLSDTQIRTVAISGGNICAAGNVTFYNDTEISGDAKLTVYGKLCSKRDLVISGGTIYADAVGNANRTSYALTCVNGDGTTRWQKTEITGGTIYTDSLGTNDNTYTTLVIEDANSVFISSRAAGQDISVYQDVYVGYIYDNSFTVGENKTWDNLHFTGTWSTGFSDIVTTATSFATITEANWLLGSLSGNTVTAVSADGILDDSDSTVAYTCEEIALYAVKSKYTLTIKADDGIADDISSLSSSVDTSVTLAESVDVSRGSEITVTLKNSDDIGKVIVWYYDANGILHNAFDADADLSKTSVTFTMPAADTTLYVTDEISLDLYEFPITLTEDGFIIEEEQTRDDNAFVYQGDIRIYQSNVLDANNSTGSTYTTAHIIKATGNPTFKRKVTLHKINQKTASGYYSILLEDGCDMTFYLRGRNNFSTIYVPETAALSLIGDETTDQYSENSLNITSTVGSYMLIGTYSTSEKTGDITFQNLRILNTGYTWLSYSRIKSDNTVTYQNVTMGTSSSRSMANLGINADNIIIDGCTFYGYPEHCGVWTNCSSVRIKDSSLNYLLGHNSDQGKGFFTGITEEIEVVDSSLNFQYRYSGTSTLYYEGPLSTSGTSQLAPVVTLKGTTSVNADGRLQLRKLVMEDSSSVTVTGSSDDADARGYLLCNDLTVSDTAALEADYIVLSAYLQVKSDSVTYESDFIAKAKSATDILSSGTLTVQDSASVTANVMVGGAYGASINVNGGILTSPAIGSWAAIFGATHYIPPVTEQAVYQYTVNASDTSCTVNVTGGTVNVEEDGYLGGYNAVVKISGGAVNLASGAAVGMTDALKTLADLNASSQGADAADLFGKISVSISGGTVEGTSGSISAPYGSVSISQANKSVATAVKVGSLKAEEGTVDIQNATGHYSIADVLESAYHDISVGVYVADTLTARLITISDQAYVYAGTTEAVINTSAASGEEVGLRITSTSADTRLYTGSYGVSGEGADANSVSVVESGDNQNIYSVARIIPIHYVLNGDSADPVMNDNPESFTQNTYAESGYYMPLSDPKRHGYTFGGWYEEEDFSGEKVTQILTTNSNPVTLYAKWIPETVTFQIVIYESDDLVTDLSNEGDGLGTYKSGTFTYTKEVTVSYGSSLYGTVSDAVNLSDYNLKTYQILSLSVDDTRYASTASTKLGPGATVTAEILDAYNKDTTTPFVLKVAAVQKRLAGITFHLNKTAGRPVDSDFTVDESATKESTSVTRTSYVDFGSTLSTGQGFIDSDSNFIAATAPGYNFTGWSTTADGVVIDTQTLMNTEVSLTTETDYYAIWVAKSYTVQFDAGTDGVVTYTDSEPDGGEDQSVTGKVYYDMVINENISWTEGDTNTSIPYAWKNGYVFEYWEVTDDAGDVVGTLSNSDSRTELNLTTFETLVEDYGDQSDVALTFTAVYRPVQVTYVTEGGTWKTTEYDVSGGTTYFGTSEDLTVDAVWQEALAGYVREAATSANTDYTVLSTVTVSGDADYGIYSTTADYYAANTSYVVNDYRRTIQRKGYTFYGWYESEDAAETAAEGDDGTAEVSVVVTTPQYEDITVYASWHANTYTLVLNAYDTDVRTAESKYKYTDFYNTYLMQDNTSLTANEDAPTATVTVGELISKEITDQTKVSVTDWPERTNASDNWYAYNKDSSLLEDSGKRYLLGFTFAPLDPGTSNSTETDGYNIYTSYASDVTKLINEDALMVKEQSTFSLPETYEYDGVSSVADYPAGSSIEMYAVYRERSLVFIQYYKDADGNEQQKEMAAYPYESWVNYPEDYLKTDDYKTLTEDHYALIGWYVGTKTVQSDLLYPSVADTYADSLDTYKTNASNSGVYDINVYTVYAAQDTVSVTLEASSDPTLTTAADSYTYTLPGSMQSATLNYIVDSAAAYNGASDDSNAVDIRFVTKDTLDEYLYDTSILSSGNTSDDTVAICITIIDPNGTEYEADDLTAGGSKGVINQAVGAGWQIRLDLYTSRVMTEDVTYTLDLKFGFNSMDRSLESQWVLFDNMQIVLTPSLYEVTYSANLPEEAENLDIDWPSVYDTDSGQFTETVAYGSALSAAVPAIEGYKNDGYWYQLESGEPDASRKNESKVAVGGNLNLAVTAADNGKIYLETDWTILNYLLSVTADVMTYWDVSYTTLSGKTVTYDGTSAVNDSSVPYHSVIQFTRKSSADSDPAEYVQLEWKETGSDTVDETSTLNLQTKVSAALETYKIILDAHDLYASRETVRTLYLDEGSISIAVAGYTQGDGSLVSWPGNYIILMNADNEAAQPAETTNPGKTNTLTLSGDLSEREINLGNLLIKSDDSISLDGSVTTKVELTPYYDNEPSTVTVNNIYVPESASLTIEMPDSGTISGSSVKGRLILTPGASSAAVGGSSTDPVNGKITLNDMEITMTLTTGTTASCIGSGDQDASGKTVELTDCAVTVTQLSSAGGTYAGAWIGGANVENVTLTNTTVTQSSDSEALYGPYALNGKAVTLSESTIGLEGDGVNSPIYASETLTVDDSKVYLSIESLIAGEAPIGTAATGTIIVKNGSVIDIEKSGSGTWNELYTGTMKIMDVNSEVVIGDTLILELAHGSVVINESNVIQGDHTFLTFLNNKTSFSGNYLLLEELMEATSATPSLTVNAMGSQYSITLRQPADEAGGTDKSFLLGDITINANTKVILDDDAVGTLCDLNVSGSVAIADEKRFTVDASQNVTDGVSVTDISSVIFSKEGGPFGDSVKGTFSQTGGTLTSTSASVSTVLGGKDMNISLDGVTMSAASLIAENLTLANCTVICATEDDVSTQDIVEGVVGSYGSYDSSINKTTDTASTVAISGTTVITAQTIGALGKQNETFTFVNVADGATFTFEGTLYRDCYRLAYDYDESSYSVAGLPTVFRTEQSSGTGTVATFVETGTEVTAWPEIPDNPSYIGTLGTGNFNVWYYLDTGSNAIALSSESTTVAGYAGNSVLSAELLACASENSYNDNTRTLTLRNGLNAVLTAEVEEGRLFTIDSFTYNSTEVTVPANGAWTALLTAEGATISGSSYQVTFDAALPEGTKLTLVVVGDTSDAYYYYIVKESDI
ncbi:MAG: InlB B-repeat-containing protein [Clostridiales bacterium]|nr:InlB B-repeat-containing protein [Clostridiales bacterium]